MSRKPTKAMLHQTNQILASTVEALEEDNERMRTLLENMDNDPNDKSLDVMVNARDVILKLEMLERRVLLRSFTVDSGTYLIERIIEMIKGEAKGHGGD